MNAFNILGGYITSANVAQAETDLTPEQREAFYEYLRSEGKLNAQ